VGPDSYLYVTDYLDGRIRKIAPSGTVSTLAGSGTLGFSDGKGTAAQFYYPAGICVGQDGVAYVADQENHRVRKILADGTVTTLAGDGVLGSVDGKGASARLAHPTGLACDSAGNLFVSEFNLGKVRKIAPDGTVTTVTGAGAAGFADGPKDSARFHGLSGLAVDSSGNVFAADQMNHAIRKVALNGDVTTVAGNGSIGFLDGAGTVARFNGPLGVAIAPGGMVVVAEFDGYRIRRIASDGMVDTLAGIGVEGYLDGAGDVAQLHHPASVAVDAAGIVYFADYHSRAIRKVAPKP
jgi:sugar lactone lactonase YvrE